MVSIDPAGTERNSAAMPASGAAVCPAFVLLFAVTPDAAARRADPPAGPVPIPDEVSEAHRSRLEALQQRLLGEPYLKARRLQRISVGRLNLPVVQEGDPAHADIHLVLHKSGAAVWEVWLSAAPQPMAVARWIGWLDMQDGASLAHRIRARLSPSADGRSSMPEMALPLWEGANPPPLHERLSVLTTFAAEQRALGPASFLYADGGALFAHGNRRFHAASGRAEPPGLWCLQQECPATDPGADGLAGVSVGPAAQSVVFLASVPLNEAPWRALADGELLVVRAGCFPAQEPG